MEERYKTLAAHGVRNIDQYNRNIRRDRREADGKARTASRLKTMPYIVVIIDELADLMMAAGNEVEESIARLAQMARAVGIHLILATQRPSVDVITGLIKANLPARIAFGSRRRLTRARFSTATARNSCWARATCSICRPRHRASCASTARTSQSRRPPGSAASCANRASRSTTAPSRLKKGRRGETRVRERRAIRRGRAHRRVERPGVDFLPAAPSRIGFSRAAQAHRHDGNGWRGLAAAAANGKCSWTRTILRKSMPN
jgi:hypothetical protein